MLAEERVITNRNIWPRRIEDPELVHSARSFNGWEQIRKELLVALAVEYQHRYTAPVICRTNDAKEVLGNDVLEQCCLPRASGPEYDRLHDARWVGPEPRL